MQYKNINEVIFQINNIQGNPEEKVIKKLVKFAEKLKPYQEEYATKVQELRLDNAATDKDGVLILNDKQDYKFTKEGLKKLQDQIKELGEKENWDVFEQCKRMDKDQTIQYYQNQEYNKKYKTIGKW